MTSSSKSMQRNVRRRTRCGIGCPGTGLRGLREGSRTRARARAGGNLWKFGGISFFFRRWHYFGRVKIPGYRDRIDRFRASIGEKFLPDRKRVLFLSGNRYRGTPAAHPDRLALPLRLLRSGVSGLQISPFGHVRLRPLTCPRESNIPSDIHPHGGISRGALFRAPRSGDGMDDLARDLRDR